ncbi:galactose-binding domain-like protein [Lentinula aff. detonsa]|nr:galactose-binding domain-like protein [Lentinula aff. detonsa]
MVSLISPDTLIKVSSTLDKSVGKKNLIDGSPETCWTSQQGLPQTITLTFPSSSSSSRGVIPKTLSLTFQGGFVGRTCAIHVRPVPVHLVSSEKATWTVLKYVYPEDVNRRQTFTLPTPTRLGISALKLTFETSSDFFGRVTIYDLELKGYRLG